jgi:hypothetical protein
MSKRRSVGNVKSVIEDRGWGGMDWIDATHDMAIGGLLYAR